MDRGLYLYRKIRNLLLCWHHAGELAKILPTIYQQARYTSQESNIRIMPHLAKLSSEIWVQLHGLSGQSSANHCASTSIDPSYCALARYVIRIRTVWSLGSTKAVSFLLHDCCVKIGYSLHLRVS
jgi:hypothetical protein